MLQPCPAATGHFGSGPEQRQRMTAHLRALVVLPPQSGHLQTAPHQPMSGPRLELRCKSDPTLGMAIQTLGFQVCPQSCHQDPSCWLPRPLKRKKAAVRSCCARFDQCQSLQDPQSCCPPAKGMVPIAYSVLNMAPWDVYHSKND